MAKLIGAAELRSLLLTCGGLKLYEIDGGFGQPDVASYRSGHIPGAMLVDVIASFSETRVVNGKRLTVSRPNNAATFSKQLGDLGITDASETIVLYARSPPFQHAATKVFWATRAWWTLYTWGFENVMVLDGCFDAAWRSVGYDITKGDERYAPQAFNVASLVDHVATTVSTTEEVVTVAAEGSTQLMDTLPGFPYTAAKFGWPGHITGAKSVDYTEVVDPGTGFFMPQEPFTQYLERSFDLSKRIVVY